MCRWCQVFQWLLWGHKQQVSIVQSFNCNWNHLESAHCISGVGSVAILVSEILDLVSPKDFGMTQYLILFSISLSIYKKPSIFLVYGALVNLVSEKHNFRSWLRRELATLGVGFLIFTLSSHTKASVWLGHRKTELLGEKTTLRRGRLDGAKNKADVCK